jgi:hypothetical protein
MAARVTVTAGLDNFGVRVCLLSLKVTVMVTVTVTVTVA